MAPSGRPSATATSSYEGAGSARSSRSSAWQPAASCVNAPHNCRSRSARRSPASSGSSRSSGRSCAVNWSTGSTCPDLRRHSRRAVVASQPGSRSASRTASGFASNRSQVACTTSAHSASGSRCARATDQSSMDKRATRPGGVAAPTRGRSATASGTGSPRQGLPLVRYADRKGARATGDPSSVWWPGRCDRLPLPGAAIRSGTLINQACEQ